MRNKPYGLTAFGSLAAFFFFAVLPVWAGSVEEKIKALEKEIAQLQSEQMRIKKDATAAEAALPTFTYRPGRGVSIRAADRSWEVRMLYLFDAAMYNHLRGNDRRDSDPGGGTDFATVGDIHLRRNRLGFFFCNNDCFYEWNFRLDFDTGDIGSQQNASFTIHFEKINPFLPFLMIADEDSTLTWGYVQRSSTTSAQYELLSDLLSDDGAEVLSRRNIGLGWDSVPVGSGDFSVGLEYLPGQQIREDDISDTDRKAFIAIAGMRPFSRTKNPWLQRLKIGGGFQGGHIDSRSGLLGDRLRIRTHERVGRQVLFDANNIGDGFHYDLAAGLEWGVGPYLVRPQFILAKYASGKVGTASDGFKGVEGFAWRIGNDLYLFSPKGPFTGAARTPGSLNLGWAFARADADCGKHAADCDPSAADFHRNRLLVRDLSLWYWITPGMRIGTIWWWYNASNTPRAVQNSINCRRNTQVALGKAGSRECEWHSVNLILQAYF